MIGKGVSLEGKGEGALKGQAKKGGARKIGEKEKGGIRE